MKIQRRFTIFELLISVALLAMLTVVLLRMFAATSDLWSASDEQSRLYADAKTAFAILSDDLGNVVYQNSSPDGKDTDVTAPLWLEAYSISGAIDCYNESYTAGIHFVTHNGFPKDSNNKTGLYAVSYRFLPPSGNGQKWNNGFSADGELARASLNASDVLYDRTSTTAMGDLYQPGNNDFSQVITGVLDFQILAYQHVDDDDWNQTPTLVDLSGSSNKGATDVETIQIVLTLMPPERITELRNLTDDEEIQEYLFKYARTFRKTFRIRTRIGDEE